jgi:hypothetical protein
VSAKNKSKIAAWSMGGASGVVGVGNLVVALTRHGSGDGVPVGMWILLGALILATCGLIALTKVLDHLEGKPYRDLLAKAAQDPANAAAYREIIDADSRHESVKNGAMLNDRQHGKLYRPDPTT